ncbi:conserved hypothetical protein [Gammaproteobacteria bacterium]
MKLLMFKKRNQFINWFLRRATEPSSMAGIAAIVGAFGIPMNLREATAQFIIAGLGLLAIAMREKSGN